MKFLRFSSVLLAALPLLASDAAAQDYRSWDRNRDGVVTRAEWRGTPQQFRNLDWNGDGFLSGRELLGQETGAQTFASLDRNANGRITLGEWRGDRASFLRLDRNGDNMISRAEFTNADARYADYAVDDFDRLDSNNNGVISSREWRPEFGRFIQFDRNRDGAITRREFDVPSAGVNDVVQDTMVVDSGQPWTDTNIYVNAGDVVTYRAAGTIQMSTDANDRATPAGAFSGRNAANAPRPDHKAGVLLARMDNGPVVVLGPGGSFTAQNSGRLLLGINDDHFPDNRGTYRVSLSVDAR